jgi:hypothetical protein
LKQFKEEVLDMEENPNFNGNLKRVVEKMNGI